MGRMKIRKRVKIMGRVKILRRVCNGVQVTTDWVFEALEAGEHYRWYVMIKISVSPCWSIGRLCWFISYGVVKGTSPGRFEGTLLLKNLSCILATIPCCWPDWPQSIVNGRFFQILWEQLGLQQFAMNDQSSLSCDLWLTLQLRISISNLAFNSSWWTEII